MFHKCGVIVGVEILVFTTAFPIVRDNEIIGIQNDLYWTIGHS
jgi:hypothetical protein